MLECKTTKFRDPHPAQYQNSLQGVGYALILDAVALQEGYEMGNLYDVYYPVYSSTGMHWTTFPFPKGYAARADFIRALLYEKRIVHMYASEGYFPKVGSGCYSFFRECPYFGACTMSNRMLVGAAEKLLAEKDTEEGAKEHYQFHFTLEDLVKAQLIKQEQGE